MPRRPIATLSPAAYVRVSTKAQDHATQRDAIERAAAARGDHVAAWFAEKQSGATLARPELDRLRALIQRGAIRRLYVFKLDRLTRSGVGDTYHLVDEIRRAGCELVLIADHLTIKPGQEDLASDVFVFALSLAAKLERLHINERIAATRVRFAAQGRPWGRAPIVTPALQRRIDGLRAEGRSVRAIAVALKVSRSVVGRAVADSLSRKDAPPRRGESHRNHASKQGASRS